jgi:serine/threonine protein kinase
MVGVRPHRRRLVVASGTALIGSALELGRSQPAGKLIGSPGYAAPELGCGAPISVAMDVYGIGTIVSEALTGDRVFDPDLAADRRPDPDSLELPARVPAVAADSHPGVHRDPAGWRVEACNCEPWVEPV